MPHNVIMPALGMAQDTGLIVSWLKQPGDAVKKGDALFEVETDKATMEVEAQDEGFLSAVAAPAGSNVPVGQVIAQIVASEGEVERGAAVSPRAPASPVADVPKEASPTQAETQGKAAVTFSGLKSPALVTHTPKPAAVPATARPPAPTNGRVLASPKAKRLALERGLNLSNLASAGVPQPYHVADLDRINVASTYARSILAARAASAALDALLAKAAPDTDRATLFAAFARGAWLATFGEVPLAVTILRLDGSRDGGGEGTPLAIADLTATSLTAFVSEGPGLYLSIARDSAAVALTLSFADADLPFASAARWLNELSARIEDPVRQLV